MLQILFAKVIVENLILDIDQLIKLAMNQSMPKLALIQRMYALFSFILFHEFSM